MSQSARPSGDKLASVKLPPPQPSSDAWAWGSEQIVWGRGASDQYTFKILEPLRGRPGCLSLQYHHEKSETWMVLRGVAWALVVVGDCVCTRVMHPLDIQNLPTGTIHRLMGISEGVRVLEPSTPDRHAADKNVPKDVVRLHCVHGRPAAAPRNSQEAQIVKRCIEVTEEAIAAIERGEMPPEYNWETLRNFGAFRIED